MIYFDNAATTYPKPECVYNEAVRAMREYGGNPGRSSHKLSLLAAEKIYECRTKAAQHFHSVPENIAFTYNTTYALNMAIKALAKKGCHILISDIEHNSVYRPVYALSRNGCAFDIFSSVGSDEEIIASVKSKIRPDTRLIVCAHASNICGIHLPIEKIGALAAERGIALIVDAAQSAGSRAIDIQAAKIDVLCVPGHKGMYGIQGCGFMVFNPKYTEERLARLNLIMEGGNGVNSKESTMPPFLPERYESGTLGTPAIAALCEGIKYIDTLKVERIGAHENNLVRRALYMLNTMPQIITYTGDTHDGSIVLFNVKDRPSVEIAEKLDACGICTRPGFHCSPLGHKRLNTGDDGAVRLSFGIFNNTSELETFYKRIREIVSE